MSKGFQLQVTLLLNLIQTDFDPRQFLNQGSIDLVPDSPESIKVPSRSKHTSFLSLNMTPIFLHPHYPF